MNTKEQTLEQLRLELALHTLKDDQYGPVRDIVVDENGVLTHVIFSRDPISLEEISTVLAATGRVCWVGKRLVRRSRQ